MRHLLLSRAGFAAAALIVSGCVAFNLPAEEAEAPEPKVVKSADVSELDRKFLKAVRSQDLATVRAMLDAGANANLPAVEGLGGPPLVEVVESSYFMDARRGKPSPAQAKRGAEKLEIIRLLLNRGAEPNAGIERHGCTSLAFAVYWNLTDVAELLLTRGAKTEPPTGPLPLNMAVSDRNAPMIALLLKNGANINSRDKGGWTPLRTAKASSTPDPSILQLLLKAGATDMGDPEAKPKLPQP